MLRLSWPSVRPSLRSPPLRSPPQPPHRALARVCQFHGGASQAVVTSPKLRKCNVAGSFLFKPGSQSPDGLPWVALFRRSGEVRTYQHMWAPISGAIEDGEHDAVATAWRELGEETGLTPDSVRLIRRGIPYTYSDASLGLEWIINPFAFALLPDAGATIRLDWEHDVWRWFDPVDVMTNVISDAVPRLSDSLRRVSFEHDLGPAAAAALECGLCDMRGDGDEIWPLTRKEVRLRARSTFADVAAALETTDKGRWWHSLRLAAWHINYSGSALVDVWVLDDLDILLTFVSQGLPRGQTLPPGHGAQVYADLRGGKRTQFDSHMDSGRAVSYVKRGTRLQDEEKAADEEGEGYPSEQRLDAAGVYYPDKERLPKPMTESERKQQKRSRSEARMKKFFWDLYR